MSNLIIGIIIWQFICFLLYLYYYFIKKSSDFHLSIFLASGIFSLIVYLLSLIINKIKK